MAKHASTSNCVRKDSGGICSGVPLLSPLPPCLPPSLCTLLFSLLSQLLPLSPWHCPRAAAAVNDDSSKHGAPPQLPPPSLLLLTWGPPLAHCCCILKEDWDHLSIGGSGSPPLPSLFPPSPCNDRWCGG
jgi:hypothetical protein